MKKKYLVGIILVILLAAAGYFVTQAIVGSNNRTADQALAENPSPLFDELNTNILTLLSKDSIPPLENPEYIKIDDVLFLEDSDKVFILEAEESVYMFPQKIMVWHEIVNEVIDGEAISITYCPLTGSAIGYEGNVGGHSNNTYGTSGSLVNSNLVMYDRETDSFIPQILGVAINSTLEGNELGTRPVYWADWKDARETYPNALVLSLSTGHRRDYFTDPYGSYSNDVSGNYYKTGESMYDLLNDNDGTFPDKKIVTGVKFGEYRMALDPETVAMEGMLEFEIGGNPAVAFYDDNINTVRVFSAFLNDSKLEFNLVNGVITDNRNVEWSSKGLSSNLEILEPLTHFDVMWFAWHAYYPDTEVIK